MTGRSCEVLIVGAGPTGLALALWLARLGVSVRIVDKTSEPGTTSRALVVHARTLEFFRQLGIADEALAAGLKFAGINLWSRGRQRAHVELGDVGRGQTPFPHVLILGQDRTEALLIEHLERAGVKVERDTQLLSFGDEGSRVVARLKGPAGEGRCEAAWLAGCDGAHSTVREGLKVGFPGGTYEHIFYVADIHGRAPAGLGDLNLALDESDFLAIFPLPGEGNARLVGTVRDDATRKEPTWEDVSHKVIEHLRLEVDRVNWFSTYHVHHRVASHFRRGRTFLLGDAAHIHSPVGGQGMNTGIGDAVNLAWKLAMVAGGRAPESLLDTYETERIAFARRLVATTDRAFVFVIRDGPIARFVRLHVIPGVLPAMMKIEFVRRFFFRTVSQIEIEYRSSALSQGHAARVHGGDRLPWVPDNFAPLASLRWQAHVYGAASPELAEACRTLGIALEKFDWSEAAAHAGLARDALYLVRPDGYVGLAAAAGDARALTGYSTQRGMKFAAPSAA
jgi:2-polyprenyl-6-methoxyphenol hydroxylase-like FAD-dependent oxidoreductase